MSKLEYSIFNKNKNSKTRKSAYFVYKIKESGKPYSSQKSIVALARRMGIRITRKMTLAYAIDIFKSAQAKGLVALQVLNFMFNADNGVVLSFVGFGYSTIDEFTTSSYTNFRIS
ncbi:MAG: hypothetical protein SO135_01110 [Sphaerochaetaceae bacterium]|jgi:hypothetical protein|nr:hypothetical protein [Sphaerochaetaceae bacterium]